MSAYLVFFSSSTSSWLRPLRYLMTLMEQTEKAELSPSKPSPRRHPLKKPNCHYPSRLLVKTTKELNRHCSSRVLEQKLERKNYHYPSRALIKKRKKLKKAVNITIQAFKMIARENFHGFQLGLCTSLLFLPRSQGKAERRRRAIPQILTLKQRQLIQQCQVDQCWLVFPLRAYARYGGYCK